MAVVAGHLRMERSGKGEPWTPRQRLQFLGALVALVVALTWPLADLATHWSLTALVLQRVILMLAAAPLLLLGLPYDVVGWLTRPAPVDALLTRCARPAVAVAVVTVLGVGSMLPVVVRGSANSAAVRGIVDVLVLVAGLVLWLPVLSRVPGVLRVRPVVRFVYLVFQAVVPAFLSFLYIFGRHPYYGTFLRSKQVVHLRPLNDQQVAGFVSKLSMLFVLLGTAAVVLARAPRDDLEEEAQFGAHDPLVWADVERSFERADRQAHRHLGAPVEPGHRPDGEPGSGSDPGSDGGPTTGPDGATGP
jgi:putative membrane protein